MARARKKPEKPKRRTAGSGSVGTRGDGRVFAKLPKDLDQKQLPHYGPGKRRRFADLAEATAWLDAEIYRLRNPTARSVSLREPLGAYLGRWYDNNSPSMPSRTAKSVRESLKHFRGIGDVPVGDLTPEVIQGAVARLQTGTWRRKKHVNGRLVPFGPSHSYKPKTIRKTCAILRAALESLVPHMLPYNPAGKIRLVHEQQDDQPVWDAQQADLFLETAQRMRPEMALAWTLVLRRALRRGEVLALQLADIDEKRRLLVVDDTAGELAGETGDTKGRKRREIPLSAELLLAVRAHRKQMTRASRWLFPGRSPDKPLSLRAFSEMAERFIEAAKLPRITPKDMRATAATILLDQNISLARVSRLLGHSNTAVTAKFYDRILKLRDDRIIQLADEFDAAFQRASNAAKNDGPTELPHSEVSLEVSSDAVT
jgi:integrase